MPSKRGRFIVIEGVDNSGKTNAVLAIASHLASQRFQHTFLTKEPYRSYDIHNILTQDSSPEENALRLAELFIKDRKEHLKDMVIPTLEKGFNIICDRYFFSTLAYQSAQGIPIDTLEHMHQEICGNRLIAPDLTILLDLPIETAMSRARLSGSSNDRKFDGQREFQEKLRARYLELVERYKGRLQIVVIDASQSREKVAEDVVRAYLSMA